jgi:hypothetical protein
MSTDSVTRIGVDVKVSGQTFEDVIVVLTHNFRIHFAVKIG